MSYGHRTNRSFGANHCPVCTFSPALCATELGVISTMWTPQWDSELVLMLLEAYYTYAYIIICVSLPKYWKGWLQVEFRAMVPQTQYQKSFTCSLIWIMVSSASSYKLLALVSLHPYTPMYVHGSCDTLHVRGSKHHTAIHINLHPTSTFHDWTLLYLRIHTCIALHTHIHTYI